MSELSDIYSQFEDSLKDARSQYDESLKEWSEIIMGCHDDYLHRYLHSFGNDFQSQMGRMRARKTAKSFLGREQIPFVAIDGSCDKDDQEGFISFYGGAYGSRGEISFEADSANLKYERWEFDKDVSMVAFLPVPPDQLNRVMESSDENGGQLFTDSEIRQLGGIHTKIMQLAEVYLGYSQVQSDIEHPRLLLMDLSLSGLLGNTSYSPRDVELTKGSFDGERLSEFDLRVGAAHPFNKELRIPSVNGFRPWNHIIHTAHEKGGTRVEWEDTDISKSNFREGLDQLEQWGIAEPRGNLGLELEDSPRAAWRRCENVFMSICDRIFREKDTSALFYGEEGREGLRCMKADDITFLTGIGFRLLIEACWQKQILLVGVAKDSSSQYFHRNFLGAAATEGKIDRDSYQRIPLPDRRIVEMLAHILPDDITAPWGTIEFDSSFLTLHPEEDEETGRESVEGYMIPSAGPVMRPERIFLRSIPIFLLNRDRNLFSHAIFVDRLAYPGWDDKDSGEWSIDVDRIGEVEPLYYDEETGPPDLQYMAQYLLSVLVRNHFPDALGYPDPLHKADWGAKSMKRRIKQLMKSGETAMRASPLENSYRDIRESYRR